VGKFASWKEGVAIIYHTFFNLQGEIMKPEIIKNRVLGMQLCVPVSFSENQILEFAEKENPCGAFNGWQLAKNGSMYLGGDEERVECLERPGFVHVVVGC
jgi:hypothetical protein